MSFDQKKCGRGFHTAMVALVGFLLLAPSGFVTPVAAQFLVNATHDLGDDDHMDGVCNAHAPGGCTFRAAVEQANANGGGTIAFALGGGNPVIFSFGVIATVPIQIDGSTPGGGMVVLTGHPAGSGNGIVLEGDGGVITGLSIVDFDGSGIVIESSNNVIKGNYIGLAPDGITAVGNGNNGIYLDGEGTTDVKLNEIGGLTEEDRNLISGNGNRGVLIRGVRASSNFVWGNFIGTDRTGLLDRGNQDHGVEIVSSTNNVIGGPSGVRVTGTCEFQCNLISGNGIEANEGDGVVIAGPASTNNRVQGNIIGLDRIGTELGNYGDGVTISRNPGNIIGGGTDDHGNVIGANKDDGVVIIGDAATGNLVSRNVIGTDPFGRFNRGNKGDGVELNSAPGNTVVRNLISGSTKAGVRIFGSPASANTVASNTIGLTLDRTDPIPNLVGVEIWNAPSNIIGGENAGDLNWIAGNTEYGVTIERPGAVNNVIQGNHIGFVNPAMPNLLGGIWISIAPSTAIESNVISGNAGDGVRLIGTAGTRIQGNVVGLDPDGAALPNEGDGIRLQQGTQDSQIGGLTLQDQNIVSSNEGFGISIFGGSGNTLQGNYVGTDPAGTEARPNLLGGVNLDGTSGNHIGTPDLGAGNLLSGNVDFGLRMTGFGATENVVKGNFIGTDFNGEAALPNTNVGIQLANGANSNAIGGGGVFESNVISGNGGDGIRFDAADDNLIAFNFIGTSPDGFMPVGNASSGINLDESSSNILTSNVVSANHQEGIRFTGAGSSDNEVTKNKIGLDADGTTDQDLGNRVGISFRFDASGNTVGGAVADGNIIADNLEAGIEGDAHTHNKFLGNLIYQNGGVGIDLGNPGATPNDISELDGIQNFPILTQVSQTLVIFGTLESVTAKDYTVEYFKSPGCDASGFGEAMQFLGSQAGVEMDVQTGIAQLEIDFDNVPVEAGDVVVATATREDRGTSEFSACVAVGGGPVVTEIVANANDDVNDGSCDAAHCSLREAIIQSNLMPGIQTLLFGLQGEIISIQPLSPLPPIESPIVLDGTGVSGSLSGGRVGSSAAPMVVIDGTNAGAGSSGLTMTSAGSTIRGLSIQNFSGVGISIEGAGATGNVIQGNHIGVDTDGSTDQGNGSHGIALLDGASDNQIGGPLGGESNVIAFNGAHGVFVQDGSGNSIRANSIFENDGLGIALGDDGVTANDADDADSGPNNQLNFPSLEAVYLGSTIVAASYAGLANTALTVEWFTVDACDPSGNGEGKTLIRTDVVNTDGSGQATLDFTLPQSLPAGTSVTATATDPAGNTSEFSDCFGVADFVLAVSPDSVAVTAGGSGSFTVSVGAEGGTYGGDIELQCVNPATGVSCSFSPASVTPGGGSVSSTLTVSTTAGAGAAEHISVSLPPQLPPPGDVETWLAVMLASLGLLGATRQRIRPRTFATAMIVVATGVLASCGGDGPTAPPPPPPPPGGTTVTRTLTLRGTSGSVQHTTSLKVTINTPG